MADNELDRIDGRALREVIPGEHGIVTLSESDYEALLATARAGLADSERLDWLDARQVTISYEDDEGMATTQYMAAGSFRKQIDEDRGSATPAHQRPSAHKANDCNCERPGMACG